MVATYLLMSSGVDNELTIQTASIFLELFQNTNYDDFWFNGRHRLLSLSVDVRAA